MIYQRISLLIKKEIVQDEITESKDNDNIKLNIK